MEVIPPPLYFEEITMRKLKSTDLFPVCRILNKIGFSKIKSILESTEVKNLMTSKDADFTSVGMAVIFDVLGIIMENISSCEADLYKFIASVKEIKVEDVMDMPIAEFAKSIKEVIMHPDFADFFKEALSFIRSDQSASSESATKN